MLNDEKIEAMLSEYTGYKLKPYYYFYCVITANFSKTMLLGSLAGLANKSYIVGLNEDELVLIGLSMSGKPNGFSIVPRSNVKSTKVSNWMFGIGKKLYFTLEDGTKLKLKANKVCMGIKKQKENLLSIQGLVNRIGYGSQM
ncbi:hypothetical protein [Clostridium sp.]|uniref:hypothetical protein n=1 Tax=Clostridium sp. TaxID=1506 RepID=UPI003D6CC87A